MTIVWTRKQVQLSEKKGDIVYVFIEGTPLSDT